MGALSVWHWLIIAILVLLLFGYKKLPDATRSLGRSMRIFKSEVNSMREENDTRDRDRARDDSAPRASKPPVIEGETISRPSQTAANEEPSRRQAE
jgi:sec-independent protein translocase protein TatA